LLIITKDEKKVDKIIEKGEKMTCSEKELQQVMEKVVEPIKQQNATLAEQNLQLQQEIAELKANQAKMFKEMLDSSIKEELEIIIKAQIDKVIDDLKRRQEIDVENLQEIANFLGDMGKRLIKHIKESKESDEKITEQGEKILEVLDDMGKGIVEAHDSILDSNSRWGEAMLKRFDTLGIGMVALGKKIDNAETSIKTNNDFTYKAVKDLDTTIHRKSW